MRRALAVLLLALLALPAMADEMDDLFEALRLPRMIEVMADEGSKTGLELNDGFLAGRGGEQWPLIVARIYEPERMKDVIRGEMGALLPPEHIGGLLEFFTSARGRQITQFEVTAREAFQIEEVEALATAAYREAAADPDAHFRAVREFVEVNGLIEANVVGALNSNLAFYEALGDVGPFAGMDQEMLLADVWASEPEVRAETTEWLYSYLLLAYGPLPTEDLEAYVALSRTEAGQALNGAIMEAFDVLFVDISKALGLGAARFLDGDDI